MSKEGIQLASLAGGAVQERFELEMQKVLNNIYDKNTEAEKVRKVTMTITIKPNEERDIASIDIQAKSALVPAKSIKSSLLIGIDRDGKVKGNELKSGAKGQTFIDDDGDPAEDTGKKIEQIHDFRRNGSK